MYLQQMNMHLHEGDTINLGSILSLTSGQSVDILDGSEDFSYVFTGLPEDSVITLGTHTATVDSDGKATIWFWEDDKIADPDLLLTPPTQYSGVIEASITLRVQDADSDTQDPNDEYKEIHEETVYFNAVIDPVADNATIAVVQPRGYEDAGRTDSNDENIDADTIDAPQNGIEVKINVTSPDDSETFNVKVDEIPDGASMYVYDTAR